MVPVPSHISFLSVYNFFGSLNWMYFQELQFYRLWRGYFKLVSMKPCAVCRRPHSNEEGGSAGFLVLFWRWLGVRVNAVGCKHSASSGWYTPPWEEGGAVSSSWLAIRRRCWSLFGMEPPKPEFWNLSRQSLQQNCRRAWRHLANTP